MNVNFGYGFLTGTKKAARKRIRAACEKLEEALLGDYSDQRSMADAYVKFRVLYTAADMERWHLSRRLEKCKKQRDEAREELRARR